MSDVVRGEEKHEIAQQLISEFDYKFARWRKEYCLFDATVEDFIKFNIAMFAEVLSQREKR